MPRTLKRVLCDTCVIIQYFKGNPDVIAELDRLGFSRLYISSITMGEIYRGMRDKEKAATTDILKRFNIYRMDKATSIRFEQLMLGYPNGLLGLGDGLIAATALEAGLDLYTDNRKDFVFLPGMVLHNPKAYVRPVTIPRALRQRRASRTRRK